ncbi:hypothetical protein GCM10009799_29400 [Nocardiopsis rhodophaea]|uniref:Uncharacterized protein n=1 Tax=Nocardiopsis rhodophaea TaxID=280238 RepID=A0ABN2T6Q2_9ACTN
MQDELPTRLSLTLPGPFAAWMATTAVATTRDANPFHQAAQDALAAARTDATGQTVVTGTVDAICVIADHAYNLLHNPAIGGDLNDAAMTVVNRFHAAMAPFTGKEGFCVDCGGTGRTRSGTTCPICKGTGRLPTGW